MHDNGQVDRDGGIWDAFDGRPHRLRLGLHPLEAGEWIRPLPSGELGAELDRKATLIGEHRDQVLAEVDDHDVAAASEELLAGVLTNLGQHHAARYATDGRITTLRDDGRCWDRDTYAPLELAGRLVTEDWCLVKPGNPPTLAAAVVCSPNRWRLADKLGRSIADIHGPVPGYERRLSASVDSVLSGRRAWWRRNWSVQSSPARFQPTPDGPPHPAVPSEVWVRSEYETLVRLPATGWWVFGIQTSVRPITDAAQRPELAARILSAVSTLDQSTSEYKDVSSWQADLHAWLESVSAARR